MKPQLWGSFLSARFKARNHLIRRYLATAKETGFRGADAAESLAFVGQGVRRRQKSRSSLWCDNQALRTTRHAHDHI
jgi:hypothetical protein